MEKTAYELGQEAVLVSLGLIKVSEDGQSFWEKYKTPLMVGGGVAALGAGALGGRALRKHILSARKAKAEVSPEGMNAFFDKAFGASKSSPMKKVYESGPESLTLNPQREAMVKKIMEMMPKNASVQPTTKTARYGSSYIGKLVEDEGVDPETLSEIEALLQSAKNLGKTEATLFFPWSKKKEATKTAGRYLRARLS